MRNNRFETDKKKEISSEESTSERIVTAALKLFCQKGYEATAVHEIVDEAKVTKPVLYYYFKNKEALFRHIIESSLSEFQSKLSQICSEASRDYRSALKSIVDIYIEGARLYPDRVRFIHTITFSGLYDRVFDFVGFWKKGLEEVTNLFEKGQKDKFFRDDVSPRFLAHNLFALAHGAMNAITYCPDFLESEPSSEEIVELFLKGVQK